MPNSNIVRGGTPHNMKTTILETNMIQRLLTLFAAAALLAACETASEVSSDASGAASASTAASASSANTASSSDGGSSSSSSSSGSSASGSSASGSSASSADSSSSAAGSAALTAEEKLAQIGTSVFFGFDSSVLSEKAQATLDRQAAFLASAPALRITIEGHCDERGTREYNLALGERRASVARDYLVAKGVDSARIRTVSYGKERPAAIGSNATAWAKNRRSITVLN